MIDRRRRERYIQQGVAIATQNTKVVKAQASVRCLVGIAFITLARIMYAQV